MALWFVKDGKLTSVTRKAPETADAARQATELLLLGPTADEVASGLASQIVTGAQANAIASATASPRST